MTRVVASITTSVDGYITAPNDVPGRGLGDGGERLHNWVFGGPWRYEDGPRGEPTGEAAEYFEEAMARAGEVVLGAGKRLFDGFEQSIDLEHAGVRQSDHATFIKYRLARPATTGR